MNSQFNGRIALVRHGQTHANIERIWHGHTDTELTEKGHRQTQSLGKHFHRYMRPDVIISSPLQRARITAEAIAAEFDIQVALDPRLMELNLGELEGATFSSLMDDSEIFECLVKDSEFSTPKGESQTDVKARVTEVIEEVLARYPEKNVVFVAHGVALSIAIAHYLDNDTSQWPTYSHENTGVSELCWNTKTLLSFNKTDHL